MSMIKILESTLLPGMEIHDIQEMQEYTKFTFEYCGCLRKGCQISNTCTPGHEVSLCRSVIDNAMSSICLWQGRVEEARMWLDGLKWKDEEGCALLKNRSIKFDEVGSESTPFTVVYGYSDDFVEIESSDGNQEICCNKASVAFQDGTAIRIEYTKQGTWSIKVTRRGTAKFTLEACKIGNRDSSVYSDRFTIYDSKLMGARRLYR